MKSKTSKEKHTTIQIDKRRNKRKKNHDFHFAAISIDLIEGASITIGEWLSRLGGTEERSHSVQFDLVFKNAVRRKMSTTNPIVYIGGNFACL